MGHGAFAVENLRTCLEYSCSKAAPWSRDVAVELRRVEMNAHPNFVKAWVKLETIRHHAICFGAVVGFSLISLLDMAFSGGLERMEACVVSHVRRPFVGEMFLGLSCSFHFL